MKTVIGTTLILMAVVATAQPTLSVVGKTPDSLTIKVDGAVTGSYLIEESDNLATPDWHAAQWAMLVNTNVLMSVDNFTNYGDRFVWNPDWEYLGFQNFDLFGGFTNASGYFVATDENGLYIDHGCDIGPSVCDGAENEDYIAFTFSLDPTTLLWEWGGGTFKFETSTNIVVVAVTNPAASFFRLTSN